MTRGRKDCRGAGRTCEPRTLAEAIYCLVHHSEIDGRTLAERLGVRYGYLMDAANADRDDVQFQSRLLVPAMEITGNFLPLKFIANELGGVFVPLPDVEPSNSDVRKAFVDVVRELGDDAALIERVLADGVVTPEEANEADEHLDRTIAALMTVKASIAAKVTRQVVDLRRVGGQAR